MHQRFEEYLLKVTQSTVCEELEVIQSLWSGYGKISRYRLDGSPMKTVVVKFISLQKATNHPRGWSSDFGHQRKVKSYQVETHWYKNWSAQCGEACKIPKFIGSFSEAKDQWIILEDLNHVYPLRKYDLDLSEVENCLKWLANFHVAFLTKIPDGLWEVGSYWHLATRPDEFELIEHQELKSKAGLIDQVLNQSKYQTIIHGDAKLANFCFSANGEGVAAVDFQYVGGGCGMKDVSYFLGSCLSSEECVRYEARLLDYYFNELKRSFETQSFDFEFKDLETEWRKMYPYACADFTRFMLGWMPTHQKINAYNLNHVNSVLSSL